MRLNVECFFLVLYSIIGYTTLYTSGYLGEIHYYLIMIAQNIRLGEIYPAEVSTFKFVDEWRVGI